MASIPAQDTIHYLCQCQSQRVLSKEQFIKASKHQHDSNIHWQSQQQSKVNVQKNKSTIDQHIGTNYIILAETTDKQQLCIK